MASRHFQAGQGLRTDDVGGAEGRRAGGQEGLCRASCPPSVAQTDLPLVGCIMEVTDTVIFLEISSGI